MAGQFSATATGPLSEEDGEATVHERVYRALRERILFGGFRPGFSVTLRGLAEELGVSPMPVREAVRRLIAERALELHGNRRVTVPAMTAAKFEQIVFARRALEPELAVRAMPRLDTQAITRLETIDDRIDTAMREGDAEGYMRGNHQFHMAIYERAEAATLLAVVTSIWLQFGPFMRLVYGRFGTSDLQDQHMLALAALKDGDAGGLRAAIEEDIMQGMRFIGEAALAG
ncbi:MAG: GntR family transcriptional regulator [Hyphomicrobiaceae bacterium]